MEALVLIGLALIAICGAVWFIAQGIAKPIGTDKCRIMTKGQVATGEVRSPGLTFIPFQGIFNDFVEVPRRFDISTDVGFALPDEKFPTTTSITMRVELCNDGGDKFNVNEGQKGTSKQVARIAATEIEEYAADPGAEPRNLDQAKKMKNEFVLRAVNELVDHDLLVQADALGSAERVKFIKKLEADLSDNGGNFKMSKFGLRLIGFSMGRFIEPKELTEVAKKKAVATEELDIKKQAAEALNGRLKIVAAGMPEASLSDISKVMFTNDGTIKPAVSETVVRIERRGLEQGGSSVDDLLGGWIAGTQAKNNQGGGKK